MLNVATMAISVRWDGQFDTQYHRNYMGMERMCSNIELKLHNFTLLSKHSPPGYDVKYDILNSAHRYSNSLTDDLEDMVFREV